MQAFGGAVIAIAAAVWLVIETAPLGQAESDSADQAWVPARDACWARALALGFFSDIGAPSSDRDLLLAFVPPSPPPDLYLCAAEILSTDSFPEGTNPVSLNHLGVVAADDPGTEIWRNTVQSTLASAGASNSAAQFFRANRDSLGLRDACALLAAIRDEKCLAAWQTLATSTSLDVSRFAVDHLKAHDNSNSVTHILAAIDAFARRPENLDAALAHVTQAVSAPLHIWRLAELPNSTVVIEDGHQQLPGQRVVVAPAGLRFLRYHRYAKWSFLDSFTREVQFLASQIHQRAEQKIAAGKGAEALALLKLERALGVTWARTRSDFAPRQLTDGLMISARANQLLRDGGFDNATASRASANLKEIKSTMTTAAESLAELQGDIPRTLELLNGDSQRFATFQESILVLQNSLRIVE